MPRASLVVLGCVFLFSASLANALVVGGSYQAWDSNHKHYYDLRAQATFTITGSQLQVILTNTSAADLTIPGEVLTAVFFTLPGNPKLTKISAVVTPGSKVNFDTPDPGNVVGGEWAYKNGLTNKYPHDLAVNQGISSSGLSYGANDLFGPSNRFPGSNLQGPTSPDGVQYGITSQGDDPQTGNGGIQGQGLIQNSVTFLLGKLPGSIHESDITNVWFQYGTDLSEIHFPGNPGLQAPHSSVPEPLTAICGLLGVVGLAGYRRIATAVSARHT